MVVKQLNLNYENRVYALTYPDSGNTREHLTSILQGKTYPRLPVVGYSAGFVIDAGANLGASSIYFNLSYNPRFLFCYEPSPSTFAYLESNLKPFSNTRCFNCGLGDSDSTSKLFDGTSQSLQRSLVPSAEVNISTFEQVVIKDARSELDVVKMNRGVLKIDTEGFEVVILGRILDLLPCFDIIYLEYHSERDRRQIDSMLTSEFELWSAQVHRLHRGDLAYVSKRLISENPSLASLEIKR